MVQKRSVDRFSWLSSLLACFWTYVLVPTEEMAVDFPIYSAMYETPTSDKNLGPASYTTELY